MASQPMVSLAWLPLLRASSSCIVTWKPEAADGPGAGEGPVGTVEGLDLSEDRGGAVGERRGEAQSFKALGREQIRSRGLPSWMPMLTRRYAH